MQNVIELESDIFSLSVIADSFFMPLCCCFGIFVLPKTPPIACCDIKSAFSANFDYKKPIGQLVSEGESVA